MVKYQLLKLTIIASFCTALLFLSSCHPLFCTWDMGFTEVKDIKERQLIGTYNLMDYSKKMMKYEGNYTGISNSTIRLKDNNTYEIINAPDWLFDDFGESQNQYINKSGKWSLTCDGSGCIMELDGLQAGELIFKKSNKLYVLLTVGDPDGCKGLAYVKNP